MSHATLKSYLRTIKQSPLYVSIGVPIIVIVFGITFALFGSYFVRLVHASFGSWGDTSLINACVDPRGKVTIVSPGTNCNAYETQTTWLKDVNAGSGLSITRSSSGATLSLTNTDGWNPSNDTWIYASGNSFTISGVDRTSLYTPGTRIKATDNSTTFYGVVVSSSFSTNTTVTLAPNNDYSLANSSITSPYYSYEENPQGYPGEFSYTPSAYGETGSAGTYAQDNVAGNFSIQGNLCSYHLYLRITNKGSWTGRFTVGLPFNGGSSNVRPQSGYEVATGSNPATQSRGVPVYYSAATTAGIYFPNGAGTSQLDWANVAVNDWVAADGSYPL